MELHQPLVDQIRGLEQSLLDPKVRRSAEAVDRLLAEGFVEFGTSGLIYDKQGILTALANEAPSVVTMSNFQAQRLCVDVILATYQTVRLDGSGEPANRSLRSSLWQQRHGRWQLVFHQGTRVPLR